MRLSPRVFISATTADLGSARHWVKEALLAVDCHPVEQTSFPPDYRTVRDMLTESIGSCDAMVHIIGFRYGAEPDPAKLPPGKVRRSYTQMEQDIARDLKKPLYVFVCPRDFPFDSCDPETQEKQALQQAYRDAVLSDERLHTRVATKEELGIKVRELQLELQAVRARIRSYARRAMIGGAALILVLGAIGVSVYRQLDEIKLVFQELWKSQPSIVGEKPKPVSELVRNDVTMRTSVYSLGSRLQYMLELLPRDDSVLTALSSAETTISLDGGPFELIRGMSHRFSAANPPRHAAVKIVGRDGSEAGPFSYDLDFTSALKSAARTVVLNRRWLSCGRGFWGGVSVCTSSLPKGVHASLAKLHIGTSPTDLPWSFDFEHPGRSRGIAYSSIGRRGQPAYLVPATADSLYGQLEFKDGTRTEVESLASSTLLPKDEFLVQLTSESDDAPVLMAAEWSARNGLYNGGGSWSLFPMVGDEVREVTWTTHEGGANPVDTYDGFFVVKQKTGQELGATLALAGDEAPVIRMTYRYADGTTKTYKYHADWRAWIRQLAHTELALDKVVQCAKTHFRYLDPSLATAVCRLQPSERAGQLFRKIFWGTTPGVLNDLDSFDLALVRRRLDAAAKAYLDGKTSSSGSKGSSGNLTMHDLIEQASKNQQRDNEVRTERMRFDAMFRGVEDWRELNGPGGVLIVTEPVKDAIYFKFVLADGSESGVVRAPLR